MQTPNLGEPRIASRHSHTISDDVRIPERIEIGVEPGLQFELAGPRAKLFFEPKQTCAGIVTCGGLCPGLNNVIRSLFGELYYGYGVKEVVGFRGGYGGLDPACGVEPVKVTPEFVDGIHQKGGTILGSSRGPVDIGRAVENLIARGVNILFTVGGDGTQRGANDLYQEARKRGHALSVVGVLCSVVGAFYYLNVIKVMYFDERAGATDAVRMELGTVVALSAIFNLLFFVYPGPLVSAATAAAKSLF